jgi:type III secretion system chaperone SycN
MSLATDIVNEFVRSIGVRDLDWAGDAPLSLSFEHRGTLVFEQSADHLLMYLQRGFDPFGDDAILHKALQRCHYQENHPFQVSVGLRGEDALIFSLRLRESEISLPALESGLELLTELHNGLG